MLQMEVGKMLYKKKEFQGKVQEASFVGSLRMRTVVLKSLGPGQLRKYTYKPGQTNRKVLCSDLEQIKCYFFLEFVTKFSNSSG